MNDTTKPEVEINHQVHDHQNYHQQELLVKHHHDHHESESSMSPASTSSMANSIINHDDGDDLETKNKELEQVAINQSDDRSTGSEDSNLGSEDLEQEEEEEHKKGANSLRDDQQKQQQETTTTTNHSISNLTSDVESFKKSHYVDNASSININDHYQRENELHLNKVRRTQSSLKSPTEQQYSDVIVCSRNGTGNQNLPQNQHHQHHDNFLDHESNMHNNTNKTTGTNHTHNNNNNVKQVELFGVKIVALTINSRDRLCLAQISNTLLKEFSYNEIHNRRVALGITCVQCTPIQLEMLRRAGAMPSSSRRCGMITMREAERLCRSFLVDEQPPELPDNFYFTVAHRINYGCRGRFVPARYISSRAKCIECFFCGDFFSPNKFIFHSHRQPHANECNPPDSPNINSWRKHIDLDWTQEHSQDIKYAWEDVKSLFNGGTRKRGLPFSLTSSSSTSSNNNETSVSGLTGVGPEAATTVKHQRRSSSSTTSTAQHSNAIKVAIGSQAPNKRIKRTSGAQDLVLNVDGNDDEEDDDDERDDPGIDEGDDYDHDDDQIDDFNQKEVCFNDGEASDYDIKSTNFEHQNHANQPEVVKHQKSINQYPLWRQHKVGQQKHHESMAHSKIMQQQHQRQRSNNNCTTPINWSIKGSKKKQTNSSHINQQQQQHLQAMNSNEFGGLSIPEMGNNDHSINNLIQPITAVSSYHPLNQMNSSFRRNTINLDHLSSTSPPQVPTMPNNQANTGNNSNNNIAESQLGNYSQPLITQTNLSQLSNYNQSSTIMNPMTNCPTTTTIPNQLALRQQFWSSLFANLQQQQQINVNNNDLQPTTRNQQHQQIRNSSTQMDQLIQIQQIQQQQQQQTGNNDQQQQTSSLFLPMNNPLSHFLAAQLSAQHRNNPSSSYDTQPIKQQSIMQQQHSNLFEQDNGANLVNELALGPLRQLQQATTSSSLSDSLKSSPSSPSKSSSSFVASLAANLMAANSNESTANRMPGLPLPLAPLPGPANNNGFRVLHPHH